MRKPKTLMDLYRQTNARIDCLVTNGKSEVSWVHPDGTREPYIPGNLPVTSKLDISDA